MPVDAREIRYEGHRISEQNYFAHKSLSDKF